MKKLYKCKVCGFVTRSKDLPELCPACGFKGKIFEEFEPTVSPKRWKALEMHAHSAVIHFPIAVITYIFFINLFVLAKVIAVHSAFAASLKAMIWLLPFVTLFGMLSGLYDGKLRFKKIKTPLLKKKLLLSILLIAVSTSLFILQITLEIDQSSYRLLILAYSIVLLSFATVLGLLGGTLLNSKVRG
ncbi:MAG: hypothetical protein MUP98_17040 [Candidatus Aminicenantes bacterium]|nr:hypothetical protein [Candidatus Aminicenantes bacterium]